MVGMGLLGTEWGEREGGGRGRERQRETDSEILRSYLGVLGEK